MKVPLNIRQSSDMPQVLGVLFLIVDDLPFASVWDHWASQQASV
jgi:hypothetical protein